MLRLRLRLLLLLRLRLPLRLPRLLRLLRRLDRLWLRLRFVTSRGHLRPRHRRAVPSRLGPAGWLWLPPGRFDVHGDWRRELGQIIA